VESTGQSDSESDRKPLAPRTNSDRAWKKVALSKTRVSSSSSSSSSSSERSGNLWYITARRVGLSRCGRPKTSRIRAIAVGKAFASTLLSTTTRNRSQILGVHKAERRRQVKLRLASVSHLDLEDEPKSYVDLRKQSSILPMVSSGRSRMIRGAYGSRPMTAAHKTRINSKSGSEQGIGATSDVFKKVRASHRSSCGYIFAIRDGIVFPRVLIA
jgi:hypothetical protein